MAVLLLNELPRDLPPRPPRPPLRPRDLSGWENGSDWGFWCRKPPRGRLFPRGEVGGDAGVSVMLKELCGAGIYKVLVLQ
jgi:hypothetical protein